MDIHALEMNIATRGRARIETMNQMFIQYCSDDSLITVFLNETDLTMQTKIYFILCAVFVILCDFLYF